jgi:uncharacterized SAM-binding protein YcdF (DUF218 family)
MIIRRPSPRSTVILAGALLVVVVASAPIWLQVPARFLAANDPPEQADAIVILSGRASERAPLAADLYHRGVAPLIITLGARVDPLSRALKEPLTEAELNARVAVRHGVPPAALVVISRGRTTWEEAQVLREHLTSAPARTLVLVTSDFGARRVRWTFGRVLPGEALRLLVVSAQPPGLGPHNWWRSERGVAGVVTESVKLVYYVGRYGLGPS